MNDPRSRTIDWDEFWTDAEGDRRASAAPGAYGKADLAGRFFALVGTPDDVAAFGCGPADVVLDLAERYPGTEFRGYDAARRVVEQARERAAAAGVENVGFDVSVLPDPDVDRQFDLVYCYATLHYVAEIERALAALYDRVRPGGHLVFNYPNRFTRAEYRRMADGDGDRPIPGTVEQFRERFRLVFDGANLLSYDRIHDVLGSWPRSYWSAVDAPDEPWTGRGNPCVYVPK